MKTKDYEINTDDTIVWVNGPERLIGRFCRFAAEVVATNETLLIHRHEYPNATSGWRWFAESMKEQHGIEVADSYRPKAVR